MKRVLVLIALGGALAAVVLGVASASAATVAGSATVKVTLVEFKLIAPATTKAGRVTLSVTNRGQLHHQLVVLRTPTRAAKLATSGTTAVETGKVGKIAMLEPGQTRTLTLTLEPGHYVLLCNLPGHYKAGQHADLAVR